MSARALDAVAAEAALRRQLHWARRGTSALHLLLGGRPLAAWQHYPSADVIDRAAGWQLYGHAHPAHHPSPADTPAEAAHLHLFQRRASGDLAHLVALSLDAKGQPLRWSTTNLWVTGGQWLPADAAHDALVGIPWRHGGRLAGVLSWVHDLIHAYRQPLHALLQRRDQALRGWVASNASPFDAALQDRAISLLSSLPINGPADLIAGRAQAIWTAPQPAH